MLCLGLGCLYGVTLLLCGQILPFLQADKFCEGKVERVITLDQRGTRVSSQFSLLEVEYKNAENIAIQTAFLHPSTLPPYQAGQSIAIRYSHKGESVLNNSNYHWTTLAVIIGSLLLGAFVWLCFFAFIAMIIKEKSTGCRGVKAWIPFLLLSSLSALCLYGAVSTVQEKRLFDFLRGQLQYAEGKIIQSQYIPKNKNTLLASTDVEYLNEHGELKRFQEVYRVHKNYKPYSSAQKVTIAYTSDKAPKICKALNDFITPFLLSLVCVVGSALYLLCALRRRR